MAPIERDLAPPHGTRRGFPVWGKDALGTLFAMILCQPLDDDLRGEPPAFDRSKAAADIVAISEAVTQFAIDHGGRLPVSMEDLLLPGADGVSYLDVETTQRDPWGRPYGLELPEPGSLRFRVFSLGKDGRPGGEGEDRDIDNLLIKEGKI